MSRKGKISQGVRQTLRLCLYAGVAFAAMPGLAQSLYPSSATNPFYGSITAPTATPRALRLSLAESVRLGLERNLGLKQAEAAEKSIQGQKKQALQPFLPTVTLEGGTGVYEHNLVTMGFRRSVLSKFTALFPNGVPAGFSTITKNDLTYGQISLRQNLFSGPAIAGWKAAGATERAAHLSMVSARGQVVEQVSKAYLYAVAAASQVDSAQALEASDRLAYEQARASYDAGVVAKLDLLRAQLQWQSQQQLVLAAQNALDQSLILLRREIGLVPGQEIILTDPAPFTELAMRTPAEMLPEALANRKDYQSLQQQVEAARATHAAYRSRRLPTLSFGGYWGVDCVNGAGTHGNFAAVGRLSSPLFREAGLRGDEQASAAQLSTARAQLADLRERIDQQLRAALLDVDAAERQVGVAHSRLALAARLVSDEKDRVAAGVDDNLPLVAAQAAHAAALTDLTERLYQFNLAKLALAKAAGVLELQYREYLGM